MNVIMNLCGPHKMANFLSSGGIIRFSRPETAKQSIVTSCLVDHGHLLTSMKIYLPPQYDQQLLV